MIYKLIGILGSATLLLAEPAIDSMVNTMADANKKSAQTQEKIDAYAQQSETLYDTYLMVEKELEEQRIYNKQLELITTTQRNEIPKLQQQLQDLEVTKKKIIPLMFEMVETLEKLVQADTPFLIKERMGRVENLKSYLSNPDISLSEQYRMILESYKIEYNYARTLEVYRSEVDSEAHAGKTVDFLRVGRVGLYYQSLDRKESAIYNLATHQWMMLDPAYNEDLLYAIKMAGKKVAPDFLSLPVLSAKADK